MEEPSILDSAGGNDLDRRFFKLNPRWMDIIGDFAGTELLVLEGDSLCQRVLDDDLLALGRTTDCSFQILHAIWSLEKILEALRSRQCNFEIVFFESNKDLYTYNGHPGDPFIIASRRLARAILKGHVQHLDVVVHYFASHYASDWLAFLQVRKPIGILCSDGELSISTNGSKHAAACKIHRRLTLQWIKLGMAVVSFDAADFRGPKVLSHVYEDWNRLEKVGIQSFEDSALEPDHSIPKEKETGLAITSQDDWVQFGLENLLRAWTEHEAKSTLIGLFATHMVILPTIPLRDRAQAYPVLNPELEGLLRSTILVPIFDSLRVALEQSKPPDTSWRPDVDVRVFARLVEHFIARRATKVVDLFHIEASDRVVRFQERVPDVWDAINSNTHAQTGPLARIGPNLHPRVRDDDDPPLALQPFKHSLLTTYLGELDIDVAEKILEPTTVPGDESDDTTSNSDDWDSEPSLVPTSLTSAHIHPGSTDATGLTKDVIVHDAIHTRSERKLLAPYLEKTFVPLGGSKKEVDVKKLAPWQKKRLDRKHQKFMASIHRHAATLTGAKGAQLERATIPATRILVKTIIDREMMERLQRADTRSTGPKSKHVAHKQAFSKAPKAGAGKKKLNAADELRKNIKEEKDAKSGSEGKKWWSDQLRILARLSNDDQAKELDLLSANPRTKDKRIQVEISMYRIHLMLSSWIANPNREDLIVKTRYGLRIIQSIHDLSQTDDVGPSATASCKSLLLALGFPAMLFELDRINIASSSSGEEELSFKFIRFAHKDATKATLYPFLKLTNDHIAFQLEHLGAYMDRSMDGQVDPRVNFIPDAWQRKVLDSLDARESVLVVAPTSAGKTFCSYYAMDQVLRESDDGIIVYVAPTKALVNQIAAEVSARFSKSSKSASVWATQIRDNRTHDPHHCQILVTIPEILATMLVSPYMARNWTPKLRWIILDEIHTIGQQEGGAVWEQLLLFAPCPIIGLSATVGNPHKFNSWVSSIQEQHGFKHNLVIHAHRYSHLRKYFYQLPSNAPAFEGLEAPGKTNLHFIHPMSVLHSGTSNLPEDLALESRDCLSLWNAMRAAAADQPNLLRNTNRLEPRVFFQNKSNNFITQGDVLKYEAALKEELHSWAANASLERTVHAIAEHLPGNLEPATVKSEHNAILPNMVHLLSELHARNDLPAILFNFEGTQCEKMTKYLMKDLKSAQSQWRATSPAWKRKLEAWEAWKAGEPARMKLREQLKKVKKDPNAPNQDSQPERRWEDAFDLSDPSPQFSFASDKTSYSKAELESDIDDLRWKNVQPWALDALKLGIGCHHAGMNYYYRTLIESLFRIGFIRVVFATDTLALGINMPVKTTVFVGDSPSLTALTYRQCAGRAGRRGLDLLGNVVFFGIPTERVHRLLTSRLPPLTGSMPLTTTLILRLFSLLHSSENAPCAELAVKSVLELPQLSVSSEIGRSELRHHFRFSIEYLQQSHLLSETGLPLIMYPIAAHLYHTEPANFALTQLLQTGVIHRLCADVKDNYYDTSRNLVALLSHFFARRHLPRVYAQNGALDLLQRSKTASAVLLHPLLAEAFLVLKTHNERIIRIFRSYSSTYTHQHLASSADNLLPLSHTTLPTGKTLDSSSGSFSAHLRSCANRTDTQGLSAFVATSGIVDDAIHKVGDLARTRREGLHLTEHAIPSMDSFIYGDTELPLNGHVYDFFNHGQIQPLIDANGIRPGDVWFYLQEFSLTMATLQTGLEQYMQAIIENDAGGPVSEEAADEGEDDAEEGDDDDEPLSAAFTTKPSVIDEGDWRVYLAVVKTKKEFDEKWWKTWS